MKTVCIALFVAMSCAAAAAMASGYDDFSRGMSAMNRHDDSTAISLFTAALAADDLNASIRPTAYLFRGGAYLRDKECAKAADDFSAVLNLKPNDPEALRQRARARACQNDMDGAMGDASAAIGVAPSEPNYFLRGRFRYLSSDFAGATDDLVQAAKIKPDSGLTVYVQLWLALARLHTGAFDRTKFDDERADLDVSGWPAPVLALFAGEDSPEEVLAAASEKDNGQRCEADFYVAEWQLILQKSDAAKPLFREASTLCPEEYVELDAARVELARFR